jgi:hypothetical protein
MAQSKVATIREFIAGSHCMNEDSLRDYHTARKIRDTVHIKGVERRIAAVKHILNAYRITLAIGVNDDAEYCITLINGGKQLNI